MEAQSAKALHLAQWLEAHPKVAIVRYPGLKSFAQFDLAQVGVGRAAQVGQAGVVGWREVVAKDHGVRWEQPGIVAAQGREGPIR